MNWSMTSLIGFIWSSIFVAFLSQQNVALILQNAFSLNNHRISGNQTPLPLLSVSDQIREQLIETIFGQKIWSLNPKSVKLKIVTLWSNLSGHYVWAIGCYCSWRRHSSLQVWHNTTPDWYDWSLALSCLPIRTVVSTDWCPDRWFPVEWSCLRSPFVLHIPRMVWCHPKSICWLCVAVIWPESRSSQWPTAWERCPHHSWVSDTRDCSHRTEIVWQLFWTSVSQPTECLPKTFDWYWSGKPCSRHQEFAGSEDFHSVVSASERAEDLRSTEQMNNISIIQFVNHTNVNLFSGQRRNSHFGGISSDLLNSQ